MRNHKINKMKIIKNKRVNNNVIKIVKTAENIKNKRKCMNN